MSTTRSITTAEQLADAGDIGPCELISGELVMMTPAGGEHGFLLLRLGGIIESHVSMTGSGVVVGGDVGFVLERNPDTVRAPDIAIITGADARDRIDPRFINGPPTIAIEIISPSERSPDVSTKTQQWLDSGTREVWHVEPKSRSITVFEPNGAARVYREGDTLAGRDLLPGLTIDIARVFAR